MSAIDNAFIRAFKADAAAAGGSSAKAIQRSPRSSAPTTANPAKISAAGPNIANASMAANKVNRPHFKPSALQSNVEHTIVPAPHIDLARFASTVTTLDEPKPAMIPVRIDPPAVAHRKPHVAAGIGIWPALSSSKEHSRLGRKATATVVEPKVNQPRPHSTNSPQAGSTGSPQAGPLQAGEGDVATATDRAPRNAEHDQRPAFEVERFSWPEPNDALIERVGPRADELVQELMAEAALGRKVVAVAGDARGAGATTLALVLARRLAKSGAKVAIVDADFAAPQLATRLGLVIGIGWETVLALPEKTSLWDTMVESIEDRLAVVPLASRSRLAITAEIAERLADCLRQLSDGFDLVLVDVGSISLADQESSWITTPGNGLDAAILACDVRAAEGERLTTIGRRLMDANIAALGVAENFCAK